MKVSKNSLKVISVSGHSLAMVTQVSLILVIFQMATLFESFHVNSKVIQLINLISLHSGSAESRTVFNSSVFLISPLSSNDFTAHALICVSISSGVLICICPSCSRVFEKISNNS